MAVPTGFTATFNSGEIFPDAQDRVDIAPITHGCDTATNLIVQISGPLKKRRGFWDLGTVDIEASASKLVPFRRSIADALMLEFAHLTCRVFQADGAPLLDGGVQVQFASPYTAAQVGGLRFGQVADVIYLRHATGLPPYALERLTDTSWQFNLETFTNGPWQAENDDLTQSMTFTGTDIIDANPTGFGAGAIMTGQSVSIVASGPVFAGAMVGDQWRIRANTGSPDMRSWYSGYYIPVGWFILSVGNVYICTATAGSGQQASMSTPPVQTQGLQNDGCNTFNFLHDGAGIVQITSITDDMTATGTVISTLPVASGAATNCFAAAAYGAAMGWPRAWPSAVEERLVSGATQTNLDMIDVTRTSGFTPLKEDYHPGLGSGLVVDTDALRRRLGGGAAGEILWTVLATFLLAGTNSGEFIISGGLFGEPLTPSSVIVRQLSDFGSEDVLPAKGHKGLYFVNRGGQTLRKLAVDMQQSIEDDDLSFLALHLASRGMVQLAWLPQPDYALWVRLADGGVAVLSIHDEQQVKGWTSQAIGGGWIFEDIVTLPGPGRVETLWAIVSRVKAGVTQRHIWMQSQVSDSLFMDCAQLYSGAPATVVAGLGALAGDTVRILADGVQVVDQVVSVGGDITLAVAASQIMVGYAMPITFVSLKLDLATLGGTLNFRERVASVVVNLLTVSCQVGLQGQNLETYTTRLPSDVASVIPRKAAKKITVAGDTSRDPRLTIVEDTAYDFGLFSLKPQVAVGGP